MPFLRGDPERSSRRQRRAVVALALLAAAASGCAVSVAADLDDSAANRVVAALDSGGIAAQKAPDPAVEGRFRVEVVRDDAARALKVLAEDGLPPRKEPSLLEALETNALVPSRLSEHARYIAGLSGELEQSLDGVDGVLSSRVHLAVPHADPLSPAGPPASASVLIRYRGPRAPLLDSDLRKLVAGAVPGLSPGSVTVVQYPAAAAPEARDLVQFGPFTTRRETATRLRIATAVLALLDILLVGFLVYAWMQLRRLRRHRDGGGGR